MSFRTLVSFLLLTFATSPRALAQESTSTPDAEESLSPPTSRDGENPEGDASPSTTEAVATPPRPIDSNGFEQRLQAAERGLEEAQQRNEELIRQNQEHQRRIEDLEADQEWTEQRVDTVMPVTSRLSGYVDVGFFYVAGDGRGIRPDTGHENFPEYAGVVPDSWVFMGDPLSTAINSRGDPADVTESRAVVYDAIHSGDNPSFIVNNINMQFFGGIGEHITVNAMVDFVPRARNISDPSGVFYGDFIDAKLGYLEYRGSNKVFDVELSLGKFDSVLGREYRTQESPDRLTVTPSLICRYTCGRPVGAKSRFSFLDRALVLNVAVTNGSYFVELFPFGSETDTNAAKTVGGRLSWDLPLFDHLEIGASGAIGAQDFQSENDALQRHFGFDLLIEAENFQLSGEFVRGEVEGRDDPAISAPCALAPCLTYQGGYAQLGYRANNWFIPYIRGDVRDALLESGASFVYISKDVRGTLGARFEPFPKLILKGEYTLNREFGDVPEFDNDVVTTSVVGKF